MLLLHQRQVAYKRPLRGWQHPQLRRCAQAWWSDSNSKQVQTLIELCILRLYSRSDTIAALAALGVPEEATMAGVCANTHSTPTQSSYAAVWTALVARNTNFFRGYEYLRRYHVGMECRRVLTRQLHEIGQDTLSRAEQSNGASHALLLHIARESSHGGRTRSAHDNSIE